MKTTTEAIFWIATFLIAYTYFIYPVLLFLLYSFTQALRDLRFLMGRKDRRVSAREGEQLRTVSVVIAAYNEEEVLREKIENLQSLDYPKDLLEFVFVSDGSSDGTNEILSGIADSRFRTIFLPQRGGKSNALNSGIAAAQNEILVLTDASTLLAPDAIHKLVRHFHDPRVGAACGALRFQGGTESQQTEGVYWKYESLLRLMEARLGATLTASGAIYAVRREAFRPIPGNTILDDLVIPMGVRTRGYGVVYDPEAIAYEVAASSVRGEFKRRVRIALGSFRALPELVSCSLEPITAFAFISHKLLRWTVPLVQLMLLASSAFLWGSLFYRFALIAQLAFYGWAVVGWLLCDRLLRVRYALLPYFLSAMNLAYLVGLIKSMSGREKATWERVA